MPNTSDIKIKIREIDKNNNEVKFSWEDSLGKRHGKNLKLGVSLSEVYGGEQKWIAQSFIPLFAII